MYILQSLSLLRFNAYTRVWSLYKKVKELEKSSVHGDDTLMTKVLQVEIVDTCRSHCIYYLAHHFNEALKTAGVKERAVLRKLCLLFILYHVDGDLGYYFVHSFIHSSHASWVTEGGEIYGGDQ